MSHTKEIEIKNRTYYFFDDMINTKIFDPKKIKTDEKSYKNILIFCIGYATKNIVKLLYLCKPIK